MLTAINIDPLRPSGYLCTTRLDINKFYILLTVCGFALYVDIGINSHYFSIQN